MVTGIYFAGGVPVAPGYGGGYPQQYYQGTSTLSCAYLFLCTEQSITLLMIY